MIRTEGGDGLLIVKGEHDKEYLINPLAITFAEHSTTNSFGVRWATVRFVDGRSLLVRGSVRDLAALKATPPQGDAT